MAKYQVIVTQDEEGMYVVECPSIPGCVTEGRTLEDALANIREAIQVCLETRRELGLSPTVDVYEVEV
ncbi:HicB family protein [Tumebacillus avium]|uniref:HicB family protein n=1 Tax=Tumebacillus avium TaxID=1903704 RepID=A0A1Y0IVK6_9BACL|nr:type II toxin-antitoxin system HicB family antitoxin [Tumebacillus avium]ARU63806.1 HicB family protein [Tumebacillus avium]